MSRVAASTRFPFLSLTVLVRGCAITIDALIDTGFDGDVAVPESLLRPDEIPDITVRGGLADGTEVILRGYMGDVHLGPVIISGRPIIALGDEPLIGHGITDRFRVILDHGERVIIES